MRVRFFLTVAAILSIHCSESPTEPRHLAFETVYAYQYSGIKAKRGEVISSMERWSAVWNEIHASHSPQPPLPQIDFGTDTVVLATMGENPDACWTVAIESVELRGRRLQVTVKEKRGQLSCACLTVTVQPVHVVRISRIASSGEFTFRRVIEGPGCN